MSTNTTYVVLLRGINVGGNNLIKMTELKKCLEGAGYGSVATYIASGNVVFTAPEKNTQKLEASIEKLISKAFSYESRVLVRSLAQINAVIKDAPVWFGKNKTHRHNVLFLKEPLTVAEALKVALPREDVDLVAGGHGVLYFSSLLSALTKSRLSRVVGTKEYKYMTIRTFGTVQKIQALMDKVES
jgi:uncharacterized protein (DUF1697 family)